nr:pescadillo homolog [Tanacetum cinerariifolium]
MDHKKMTTTHKDEYNLGELEPSLIQQEYTPVIFAQDTIEHVISLDMLTGKEDRENVMRARELRKAGMNLVPRLKALAADLYALTRYVGAKDKTNGTNFLVMNQLLFVITSSGGLVSWEGDGAIFEESNQDINYQRLSTAAMGVDCINARIIPPTEDYMVGKVLPPHLSPFVDNEE